MYNNDFFQEMSMDSQINGDNNFINNEMEVDVNMSSNQPMMNNPVNEGVQERVVHRTD